VTDAPLNEYAGGSPIWIAEINHASMGRWPRQRFTPKSNRRTTTARSEKGFGSPLRDHVVSIKDKTSGDEHEQNGIK